MPCLKPCWRVEIRPILSKNSCKSQARCDEILPALLLPYTRRSRAQNTLTRTDDACSPAGGTIKMPKLPRPQADLPVRRLNLCFRGGCLQVLSISPKCRHDSHAASSRFLKFRIQRAEVEVELSAERPRGIRMCKACWTRSGCQHSRGCAMIRGSSEPNRCTSFKVRRGARQ
jgi:hypothetical protein